MSLGPLHFFVYVIFFYLFFFFVQLSEKVGAASAFRIPLAESIFEFCIFALRLRRGGRGVA